MLTSSTWNQNSKQNHMSLFRINFSNLLYWNSLWHATFRANFAAKLFELKCLHYWFSTLIIHSIRSRNNWVLIIKKNAFKRHVLEAQRLEIKITIQVGGNFSKNCALSPHTCSVSETTIFCHYSIHYFCKVVWKKSLSISRTRDVFLICL